MPFTLKVRCDHRWAALPGETFRHHGDARERAAALLLTRPAGVDMVAVCAETAGAGRAVTCLTARAAHGARATEWPGVWEWGPPADAFRDQAEVAAG